MLYHNTTNKIYQGQPLVNYQYLVGKPRGWVGLVPRGIRTKPRKIQPNMIMFYIAANVLFIIVYNGE